MKRPVKTHTFNGRKYKIFIDGCHIDGECDQFKIIPDDRRMSIYADITTKNGLITLIHESLHAENWRASEKSVDRTSMEIGDFLWRLGFRLSQNK